MRAKVLSSEHLVRTSHENPLHSYDCFLEIFYSNPYQRAATSQIFARTHHSHYQKGVLLLRTNLANTIENSMDLHVYAVRCTLYTIPYNSAVNFIARQTNLAVVPNDFVVYCQMYNLPETSCTLSDTDVMCEQTCSHENIS